MSERLFVILGEDESFYVEQLEAGRITYLLGILPSLKDWTPLASVAAQMSSRLDQAASTVRLMRAAQRIEKETPYCRQILAEAPILKVKKDRYNKRKNATKRKYMRAPIYIKRPDQPNQLSQE